MELAGRPHSEGERALERLIHESLDRGHWRVACRRYLMLRATGERPAPALAATCEGLLAHVGARELRAMRGSAEDWAAMVRSPDGRRRGSSLDRPSLAALSMSSPFRVSWMASMPA